MTPKEYERLQGFPDYWTLPQGCEADNDDVDTLRYTALGNAVSVPVVEWVARRIKKVVSAKYQEATLEDVAKYVPEFSTDALNVDIGDVDYTDTTKKHVWPKAGIAWKNHFIGGSVSPSPVTPIVSSLYELVEKGRVGEKYYLSPNASAGIIRRVDSQGRKLFSPLRVALEREAHKTSVGVQE